MNELSSSQKKLHLYLSELKFSENTVFKNNIKKSYEKCKVPPHPSIYKPHTKTQLYETKQKRNIHIRKDY